MARKVSEINASSQADIAFLLLIFFLVTTSMNVDQGLSRLLPPPAEDNKQEKADQVNERNILIVLINKDNMLAIEGEQAQIDELKDRTVDFILNPRGSADLCDKVLASKKMQEAINEGKADDARLYKDIIAEMGDVEIPKGIVSLQNDRGTKYETYIQVQNEIVAAFNDVRDQISKQTWGLKFDDLDEEKQKLVKTVYPLNISEAEPRSVK